MIELALPAGSLETALLAFQNGADAVYFGLKDFSARKGAVNFSIEDLSKIRQYSRERGKKTYITINTLVDDASIPSLVSLLNEVSFYGTDGIIVQDLGVAEIIKKYFPSLPLHGSTQLAVHTTEGARALQDLGFERVVLSRELSLREIEGIRKECQDIELKAFIHGALCYGFSGLCSASAIKCGRSANGGECAQICRSWFQEKESGRKGYFFSMEDMMARERLLELERIGIDSAKVEGRLKSPEYTASTARYYKSILEKGFASKEEEDGVRTSFLRKSGTGYFDYKKERPSLLSGEYPGHLGLYVGKVVREEGSFKTVSTTEKVENHDGLQYFTTDRDGLASTEKFSAVITKRSRGSITLRLETKDKLIGREIYKISDSTKREKTPSTNIPLFRKPLDIEVKIGSNTIEASSSGVKTQRELEIAQSRSEKDVFELIEKTFKESGLSKYTLGRLTLRNDSGFSSPFLPPSILKDFRRDFYSELDRIEDKKIFPEESEESGEGLILPDRKLLSDDLAWSLDPKKIGDRIYITLPPVTFDERRVWNEALEKVKGKEGVTIGLNNISQLRFASEHPEFDYFADIYLYVPNRFAALLLKEQLPTLKGGYLWFERKAYSGPWPWKPTITDFEPPYFISRTCFRHDAMGKECKGCPGKEDYTISQGQDEFTVKIRSCLTVVERKKKW